jgi:predicted acylesterase/phospholipase RssA
MKALLLISIIVIASLTNSKSDDGKCRALALRGGGTKGAYEVGALKAMAALLDPKEIEYDVVVGVSIGALNAALFAFYEKGDEQNAIAYLESIWLKYLA